MSRGAPCIVTGRLAEDMLASEEQEMAGPLITRPMVHSQAEYNKEGWQEGNSHHWHVEVDFALDMKNSLISRPIGNFQDARKLALEYIDSYLAIGMVEMKNDIMGRHLGWPQMKRAHVLIGVSECDDATHARLKTGLVPTDWLEATYGGGQ